MLGLLGQVGRVQVGHELRRYATFNERDDADTQGRECEAPAFASGDQGGFRGLVDSWM